MRRLRWALVALLIASTALFAAGVIAERSAAEPHAEPESTPLIVVAVLAGLGLAALAASRLGTVPGITSRRRGA